VTQKSKVLFIPDLISALKKYGEVRAVHALMFRSSSTSFEKAANIIDLALCCVGMSLTLPLTV
jgi:hypothetical protein